MPKTGYENELKKELAAYGVAVEREHIPEIFNTGVDTFLERRGIYLSEKQLTALRLIMHCIRENEHSIPPLEF